MLLVVDTNILVSFFRDNPVNNIISESRSLGLELCCPQYAIEELKANKSDVLKYAQIDSEQFNKKLSELLKLVNVIPNESFKEFESQTKQLIHDKDVPIFALALKLNCAIWSNEPRFKSQPKVDVFSNKDMIELFGDSFTPV